MFALASFVCFGLGDFFIQKTTRKIGIWEALFFITMTGAIFLFPFVYHDFFRFIRQPGTAPLLLIISIVTLLGALVDFMAMKQGKMAVVEPIISFELPLTLALSAFFLREVVSPAQLLLIASIFIAILVTVSRQHTHLHFSKRVWEKGVWWAVLAAVGLALTNFFTGLISRDTSPLFAIWFTFAAVTIPCVVYLWTHGKLGTLYKHFKRHPKIIVAESFFDTAAWLCYAVAMAQLPVSVATGIVEGYVALAVILGIFFNRERLKTHQKLGAVVAIAGVLFLAMITKG